jgi:glycosyltransferase involved in cell wall biosynthesis
MVPPAVLPAEAPLVGSALMPSVDVIVPVYRNLEATRRCIESIIASSCRTSYELLLVNDATPEAELARYLRELADRGQATRCIATAMWSCCSPTPKSRTIGWTGSSLAAMRGESASSERLRRMRAPRRIRFHAAITRCRRE